MHDGKFHSPIHHNVVISGIDVIHKRPSVNILNKPKRNFTAVNERNLINVIIRLLAKLSQQY